MRVAQIIKKHIFNSTYKFNGEFAENCEKDAVPSELLQLVNMIMDGQNIRDQIEARHKITLSLSQLIMYNCVKRTRATKVVLHHKSRECPLPIYLSMEVHSKTRDRGLIYILHKHGLGISYTL